MSDQAQVRPAVDHSALLESALADVYEQRDADGENLKTAVCAFTESMKSDGWSAERVIVEVKRISALQAVNWRSQSQSRRDPPNNVLEVLAQAVRWCIDDY